ncbi:acyl-CoA dehydrogenase [Oceanobacillus piezotolerans]|uniref:Acyl-CoA dehydrogenase n=1 Tax=Oceanobacillus piezotolerans TaxID=2448030 RepID=A0A498D7G1_9BACI|nr:acyl-CoA dehydrogenase family protein [Oceanobacillus piezotolerans]RLL43964.1 acyl-CoA dehydrogenase [Oceanobacillus piezotolerans]
MAREGNTMVLDSIIKEDLKPLVKKIDSEAFYAEDYLLKIGKHGLFNSDGQSESDTLKKELEIVEKTSEACMTTGFNVWCHLAALTYLRQSDNDYLKNELLPLFENGELLGGTGLSNPMKFYSGLERLHLKAERKAGGYLLNGNLGSVSNLNKDHWFGVIAAVEDGKEIMAFVPCDAEGLDLKEKTDYIGVNGSATYACKFKDVFIADNLIISKNAEEFVDEIRPAFIMYQIPLGLGVTSAAIQSMKKAPKKQGGINKFLNIQPEDIEDKYLALKQELNRLAESKNLKNHLSEILKLRLEVAQLTIEAVHGDMLHYGGAAYLKKSNPSRRLRESYFLLNLTPTVKHLEKLLSDGPKESSSVS